MLNFTVNPFLESIFTWYSHGIGIIVLPLNLLTLYLIYSRTPKHSHTYRYYVLHMQVDYQLWSTLIDLHLGVLFMPMPVYPLFGGYRNGILCRAGVSMHYLIVSSLQMRGNIVVDQCSAWDEDKWAEIRIGEAELECYKPCTRCVLSTVGTETGEKDAGMQPLKKLREFRLAPDGKMREAHGQSPIFGVNAGLMRPGYIHVGQTVYVKYKPSAF